jgi:TetR/AcrR family transcriptional regulator
MAHITGRETPQDEDYANAAATITRLVLGGVMPTAKREERVLMFAT